MGHALGRTPSQNVRTARFRMMEDGARHVALRTGPDHFQHR
ncbi:hypothetical protein JET82_02265 [Pseudomonas aeruginosa]|nr:hypothetical protein [Pseudomonas aeruginosa]MBI6992162.1 hypothetical protein [Pseudomonas aeruginosa]